MIDFLWQLGVALFADSYIERMELCL